MVRSALCRRVRSSGETRGSSQIEFSSTLSGRSEKEVWIFLFFCSLKSHNANSCGSTAWQGPAGNLSRPPRRSKDRSTQFFRHLCLQQRPHLNSLGRMKIVVSRSHQGPKQGAPLESIGPRCAWHSAQHRMALSAGGGEWAETASIQKRFPA